MRDKNLKPYIIEALYKMREARVWADLEHEIVYKILKKEGGSAEFYRSPVCNLVRFMIYDTKEIIYENGTFRLPLKTMIRYKRDKR